MLVEKDSLRSHYKRKLHELNNLEKIEQSQKIVSRLREFLKSQRGVWSLFSPLNDEPNLLELYDQCPHLTWVFPKVQSKTEMQFFAIDSKDELVASSWGMGEPPPKQQSFVDKQGIQGFLVPGIAFDMRGNRLGRGGGYYDRFLQHFKGLKLGVTFNEGLTKETLPRKSHDQQMNIVVSPENWIEVEESEVNNGI